METNLFENMDFFLKELEIESHWEQELKQQTEESNETGSQNRRMTARPLDETSSNAELILSIQKEMESGIKFTEEEQTYLCEKAKAMYDEFAESDESDDIQLSRSLNRKA